MPDPNSAHPLAGTGGWRFQGAANVVGGSVSSASARLFVAGAASDASASASLWIGGGRPRPVAARATLAVSGGDTAVVVKAPRPFGVGGLSVPFGTTHRYTPVASAPAGTNLLFGVGPSPVPFSQMSSGGTPYGIGVSSRGMAMVVANSDPWPATAAVAGLVVAGGGDHASTPCPLFLANDGAAPSANDMNMYVSGDGMYPGFSPSSSSMPMLVQRSGSYGATLFLANRGDQSEATLFVSGSPEVDASATLWVSGLGGTAEGVTTLFVHGSDAAGASSAATLAIPATAGLAAGVAALSIDGWEPF